MVQTRGEILTLGHRAVCLHAAKDDDLACLGIGEEEVTVGCSADQTRLSEAPLSVKRNGKAFRGDGCSALGTRDDRGAVIDGLLRIGCGKILNGEMDACTRFLLVPVVEGVLSGGGGLRHCVCRNKRRCKEGECCDV